MPAGHVLIEKSKKPYGVPSSNEAKMAKNLSEHFTLDEFTLSQTAARLGLDNSPDAEALKNLKRLAESLEEVRSALGNVPILISSGYRSPTVNKAVGGAANSAHMSGLAVDFTAPQFGSVLATAKAIAKSGIEFDQVIFEYGRWVHLGLSHPGFESRAQLLSIGVDQVYQNGLRTV
jgi:hypothetical protein